MLSHSQNMPTLNEKISHAKSYVDENMRDYTMSNRIVLLAVKFPGRAR